MMTAHGQIDPNTGRAYELCPDCDCPMLPPGVEKRPNEYDHASGCPREVLVVHRVFEMSHIRRGRLATSLDPGIRGLVNLLRYCGFDTCDSGDGVTKPAEGYEEAQREPHVHIRVRFPKSLIREAKRLRTVLGVDAVKPGMVQATYDPVDNVALLSVTGLDDASLKMHPAWDSVSKQGNQDG